MRYALQISDAVREQLRALAVEYRRNIGRRLDLLQDDLTGNVKKSAPARQNIGCGLARFVCCSPWKAKPSSSMLSKTVKKPTTKPARAAGRRTLDTLSREVVRLAPASRI